MPKIITIAREYGSGGRIIAQKVANLLGIVYYDNQIIDLAAQEVRTPNGEAFKFEIDPFRKHCLLNGLDDIGLTLQAADDIRAYEEKTKQSRPWVFAEIQA